MTLLEYCVERPTTCEKVIQQAFHILVSFLRSPNEARELSRSKISSMCRRSRSPSSLMVSRIESPFNEAALLTSRYELIGGLIDKVRKENSSMTAFGAPLDDANKTFSAPMGLVVVEI